MKIFDRDSKVNFVDENNVLVGFDFSQSCCESPGWSLSRALPEAQLPVGDNGIVTDGFVFDRTFFSNEIPKDFDVQEGGIAVFRLMKGEEVIFLTLWNSQNGYYGHGFEMEHDGIKIKSGIL